MKRKEGRSRQEFVDGMTCCTRVADAGRHVHLNGWGRHGVGLGVFRMGPFLSVFPLPKNGNRDSKLDELMRATTVHRALYMFPYLSLNLELTTAISNSRKTEIWRK